VQRPFRRRRRRRASNATRTCAKKGELLLLARGATRGASPTGWRTTLSRPVSRTYVHGRIQHKKMHSLLAASRRPPAGSGLYQQQQASVGLAAVCNIPPSRAAELARCSDRRRH
jgi:hypothetical protein